MSAVDKRFKLARIEAGFSQRVLAVRLGVSEHVVSKWETCRLVPDKEMRGRVAALLFKAPYEIFPR